ncbi:MAG: YraN family protein [Clostridiales bacterium]|nr:YraN family protein [Clostridiales bacterium]
MDGNKRNFTGALGEIYASRFLRENGFRILSANYRTRMGEIDIAAFDGDTVVFAEVKTRGENMTGTPAEAVTEEKIKKLTSAALLYMRSVKGLLPVRSYRFDVIEVYVDKDNALKRINHIKSAFEASVD